MNPSPTLGACSVIRYANVVFWDFDGVIKDSVDVKTVAYENLFAPYGLSIADQVRQHHQRHGGVSRFDKIPLYLKWAGETVTDAIIDKYCEQFSVAVRQAVIDSPWVHGVREYLLQHYENQYFVLVTATPEEEIQQIIAELNLAHCFREVHGAPKDKAKVIKHVLGGLSCAPGNALMVGDSEADLKAAYANSVPFLLRRTPLNLSIQASYTGPMFNDLNHE